MRAGFISGLRAQPVIDVVSTQQQFSTMCAKVDGLTSGVRCEIRACWDCSRVTVHTWLYPGVMTPRENPDRQRSKHADVVDGPIRTWKMGLLVETTIP